MSMFFHVFPCRSYAHFGQWSKLQEGTVDFGHGPIKDPSEDAGIKREEETQWLVVSTSLKNMKDSYILNITVYVVML